MSLWHKQMVEHLESNCFHNRNGEVLERKSDKYYNLIVSKYLARELTTIDNEYPISVLDFGCGTGRQLELNLIPKENYTGFDSSIEMIEKARNKFPKHTFISDKKDLENKCFDLVLCNDVLQHVSSIDEFKSLLKELASFGNYLVLHFWYTEEPSSKPLATKIFNTVYPEFFISKKDLEEILLDDSFIKYSDIELNYFDKQKPYKCCVLELNLLHANNVIDLDFIESLEQSEKI